MAENFATLEYKTQEEVLTIIKHLTSILSTTGMQVMHLMSPSDLLSQLHNDSMVLEHQVQEAGHNSLSIQVARTSIIIGVIAILKSYLQGLYGLSYERVPPCSEESAYR
jgi:cohesin loading factor subunit SCC2